MKQNRNPVYGVLSLLLLVLTLMACVPTGVPPSPNPNPVGAIGQRTKTSGCVARNGLPDSACSPGGIFPDATKPQICTSGYSKTVRDVPTALKDQVFAEYGITAHAPGEYEVDHLISLELGGSNDIANLWPEAAEPRPGFHEKDQVENLLRQQVCSGAITLQTAQVGIARNWLVFSETGAVARLPTGSTLLPPTAATAVTSGRYAASSEAKKYFYCVTDLGWQSLKSKLIWSNDPSVFTSKGLQLHAPCR